MNFRANLCHALDMAIMNQKHVTNVIEFAVNAPDHTWNDCVHLSVLYQVYLSSVRTPVLCQVYLSSFRTPDLFQDTCSLSEHLSSVRTPGAFPDTCSLSGHLFSLRTLRNS